MTRMDAIHERLLNHTFPDHTSALDYCTRIAAGFGYNVKHDQIGNKSHVHVIGEGTMIRLVLEQGQGQENEPCWIFSKEDKGGGGDDGDDMGWPQEAQEMMIQLVRQRLPAHVIRQTLQQQFPSLMINDAAFSRKLDEERARGVQERSQRLLVLSARLCAVVAANEEWTRAVEHNMAKMIGSYRPTATPEVLDSLATLGTVQSPPMDASSKKKQKNDSAHKGMQLVQVPEYTLTIQEQQDINLDQHRFDHPMFAQPQQQQQPVVPHQQQQVAAAAAAAASYGGIMQTPQPSSTTTMPFAFEDAIMAVERPPSNTAAAAAAAAAAAGAQPFFYPPRQNPSSGDLLHH
ncbi:hypothetical protein RO3G_03251 [Lichtheimia corymbifera JMRC:FSU:9682]|uniref:Uncharacterized protein n=1 Tax=Lichtheimia corymbifera JMRC:FSU:9682 TaxID=1263082 RepID=A0A068RVK4_9FUNG|nr:hypothetical protein RO3G_03251 [Lichtheimia corymbifera JMRC:FSU:9682]